MKINVSLEAFEGPLDLLLHLIDKNEVDIYDIPIALLTDQYIDAISLFPNNDMEAASEFILMAATLLEIKSKTLLPKTQDEAVEAAITKDELIARLILYRQYKEVSKRFEEQQEKAGVYLFRNKDEDLIEKLTEPDEARVDEVLEGLTLGKLYQAFEEVLLRRDRRTDKVRSSFSKVVTDKFTVEEKVEYLKNSLSLYKTVSFSSLFRVDSSKIEMIVTFLALLELIKLKHASLCQENLFGEIVIQAIEQEKL